MTRLDPHEPVTTLRTSDNASDPAVSWKVKCLNCGAALAGPFCAECGQRALPPHPSTRELLDDALEHFLGWDGKFAETLRLIVARPGELTRQWLEGRRVHFISPLRLYFSASLVYFLIAAAAPTVAPKQTFSFTFNASGTYTYKDELYPKIRGTITVKGLPPTLTLAASSQYVVYGDKVVLLRRRAGRRNGSW